MTNWEGVNAANLNDYMAPKVAAAEIRLNNWNQSYLEVAVVYMIQGLSPAEIADTFDRPGHEFPVEALDNETNNDWDIGMTTLRWNYQFGHGDDYPTRTDYFIPDKEPGSQHDDFHPNLAYDLTNGNIYVVFSDIETPGDVQYGTPGYCLFERAENGFDLELDGWDYNFGGWSDDYPRQIPLNSDLHSGWLPVIDVGLIDYFVDGDFLPNPGQTVVVGYTSQYSGQTGFHCNIAAWSTDSGGYYQRTVMPIRHPNFRDLSAGLPSLDIAPRSSARHYGALVFSQVTGFDKYGPSVSVFYVDSFALWQLSHQSAEPSHIADSFIELSEDADGDDLYPSVAIHQNDSQEWGTTYDASVTWLAQNPWSSTLHPVVTQVHSRPATYDAEVPGQGHKTGLMTALTVDALHPLYHAVTDPVIDGNYNPTQMFFINPGVSTTIRALGDSNYWAAWNNSVEMEPPPACVWGAYGNTNF